MDWLLGRNRPAPPHAPPAVLESVEKIRQAGREVHEAAEKVKPRGSGQWVDVKRALDDMNRAINRYKDEVRQ